METRYVFYYFIILFLSARLAIRFQIKFNTRIIFKFQSVIEGLALREFASRDLDVFVIMQCFIFILRVLLSVYL